MEICKVYTNTPIYRVSPRKHYVNNRRILGKHKKTPMKPLISVAYSQGKYSLAKVPTMKPTQEEIARNKAAHGVAVDAATKEAVAGGEESNAAAEVSAAPVISEEPIDFSKVEIEPLFADMVDFDTFSKSDFRAVKCKACEAVKKSKKLLKFVLDDGTGTDRVILSGIHMYYEPEELVDKTLLAITNLPPRPMMGIDSCGMLISAVHHEEGAEKLHLIMLDPHIPAGAKMY